MTGFDIYNMHVFCLYMQHVQISKYVVTQYQIKLSHFTPNTQCLFNATPVVNLNTQKS